MADLEQLGKTLLEKGPQKLEPSPKRIRVLFNKIYIVDTTSAKCVWEHPYYPQYYVPHDSIKSGYIQDTSDSHEGFTVYTLNVNGEKTSRVLGFNRGPLSGYVRLEFSAMQKWFEEEAEIYVHPKDPYKRIDIIPSSRTVKVEIDGKKVAESDNVMMLYETGLPTRYYLPQTSVVDWALLDESKTTTSCPYKGEANYYNVIIKGKAHNDSIWWYKYPTSESLSITGRLCFYNEKVDIWVDGEKLEKPKTAFS